MTFREIVAVHEFRDFVFAGRCVSTIGGLAIEFFDARARSVQTRVARARRRRISAFDFRRLARAHRRFAANPRNNLPGLYGRHVTQ